MRNNTMIYESNSFFIVPKNIEKYNISNDAIMLYARMLDLSKLSEKVPVPDRGASCNKM